jgi:hypothetical protein
MAAEVLTRELELPAPSLPIVSRHLDRIVAEEDPAKRQLAARDALFAITSILSRSASQEITDPRWREWLRRDH